MKREDLTVGMHVAVDRGYGDRCTYDERVIEKLEDPEDGLGYVTTYAVNHLGHVRGGTGEHTQLAAIVAPWADRPVHVIDTPFVVTIRVDHEPRGWLKITDTQHTAGDFGDALGLAIDRLNEIARDEASEARDARYRARVQVIIAESANEPGFPLLARDGGRTYHSGWVDVHVEIKRLTRLFDPTEG